MITEFHPVTRKRWPDLDRLFSESAGEELGNPSRCWCMEWRTERHHAPASHTVGARRPRVGPIIPQPQTPCDSIRRPALRRALRRRSVHSRIAMCEIVCP